MKPDTPVAIGSAACAVTLLVIDVGWLVTAALIAGAGLIVSAIAAFVVWEGRRAAAALFDQRERKRAHRERRERWDR